MGLTFATKPAEEQLETRRIHIAGVNRNGLLISTAIMPLMIGGMVYASPILKHVFNQNETVASLTQNFVRPYAITIPASMLRICSEQVMFAFGKTKPAMIMALTSFAACMSFGSMLAFGSAGLPRLGQTGVLIGCISEAYLTAIAFSIYIAKGADFKAYKFFDLLNPLKPHLNQLKEIIKLGKSFLFTMFTETTLVLASGIIAGLIGTNEQVALSSTMLFSLLLLLLQAAFGQSCSQEMSRKLGEKHFTEVSRLGKVGLLTTLGFIAPILLVLAFNPSILESIVGENNESIRNILRYLVPIIAAGCISDAARFNLLQQLRALGDTKGSSLVSSGALALGMSTAALLGLKTNMGIYGVATGYTGGITLATAALLYRWNSRIKPDAIKQYQENPGAKAVTPSCFAAFFKPTNHRRQIQLSDIEQHDERLLIQLTSYATLFNHLKLIKKGIGNMLTNLSLLPHDNLITIKDIVQRINYIALMKNLLEEFQDALNCFQKNELYKFDAQVGETLCQIRAYKIYSLQENSFPLFFDELKELKIILDKTIQQLALHAQEYQALLKLHKSQRPDYIRTPITLIDFFSDLGCIIPIQENALYIFISYFLCRYHIVDADKIPTSIDYTEIAKNLNLSRSYSKKLGHFYQKSLSEFSCKFIFQLLTELSGKHDLKHILPQLHRQSDEGRMVLPCYCVTEIIVLHMIDTSANLVLLVDVKNEDENERMAFCLNGSKDINNFKLMPLDETNDNKPCVVMYGECVTTNVFFKETFQSELISLGLKHIILSNNAAHPQYSGETLKHFKDDPFRALIDEEPNELSQVDILLIENLSNELSQMKQLAEEIGCTIKNQGLFLLKHIYCNQINAYIEHYLPGMPLAIDGIPSENYSSKVTARP